MSVVITKREIKQIKLSLLLSKIPIRFSKRLPAPLS